MVTNYYLIYVRFEDRPMNWWRAKRYCQRLGAKMVEIDSAEENRAIVNEIRRRGFHRQRKQFWLGLTDRRREGQWVYESTLRRPRFENWDSWQPDDGGWWFAGEDCAYIKTNTKWNDWYCNQNRFRSWTFNALCEKDTG